MDSGKKDSPDKQEPTVQDRRHLSRKHAVLFILVFAAIGGIAVISGFAASPTPSTANYTAQQSEKLAAGNKLQNSPEFKAKFGASKLNIIKSSDQLDEQTGHEIVDSIAVDYATGQTERVILDVTTGQLTSEAIKGRAQSSNDERQQALSIIKSDSTIGPLLAKGQVLSGGFLVSNSDKVGSDQRVLQYKLMSADHKTVNNVVLVDLIAKRVVSITTPKIKTGTGNPEK